MTVAVAEHAAALGYDRGGKEQEQEQEKGGRGHGGQFVYVGLGFFLLFCLGSGSDW